MTVAELIKELEKEPNKSKQVVVSKPQSPFNVVTIKEAIWAEEGPFYICCNEK